MTFSSFLANVLVAFDAKHGNPSKLQENIVTKKAGAYRNLPTLHGGNGGFGMDRE